MRRTREGWSSHAPCGRENTVCCGREQVRNTSQSAVGHELIIDPHTVAEYNDDCVASETVNYSPQGWANVRCFGCDL